MKIRSLNIQNFRSLANVSLNLKDLVAFVGRNDAGKSNVLDALELLFEGTASDIRKEDFYNAEHPIEVRAVLEGVQDFLPLCDERNRPKIEERIHDGDKITIRRLSNGPGNLTGIEIL